VEILGSLSRSVTGGTIKLVSGVGNATSSGDISLQSLDTTDGVSGALLLSTGTYTTHILHLKYILMYNTTHRYIL